MDKNYDIVDSDYKVLSDRVYKDYQIGEEVDVKWQVIEVWDDRDNNGMQAFAVAPLDENDLPDYDHIIISYRGTEGDQLLSNPLEFGRDLKTDIKHIFGGSKTSLETIGVPGTTVKIRVPKEDLGQFGSGLTFAEEIETKYPNAYIETTGHSLGGSIAMLVAVERDFNSNVFAAPNAYRLLSDEGKAKVNAGLTQDGINNYIHDNDIIGKFDQFGAPLIAQNHFTRRDVDSEGFVTSLFGIGGHLLGTYNASFDESGNIIILYAPETMRQRARELKNISNHLLSAKELLEDMIQNESEAMLSLAKKLKAQTTPDGEYSEIEQHEIDEMIRDLAPYPKNINNLPSLYDPEEVQLIIEDLEELHERCYNISENLSEAANTMEQADNAAAVSITGAIGGITIQ